MYKNFYLIILYKIFISIDIKKSYIYNFKNIFLFKNAYSNRNVKKGTRFFLSGRLHKNSYGGGRQEKEWKNYPVRIVRIIEGRECPILLGDEYTDELGWVTLDELTKVNYSISAIIIADN